MLRIVIIVVLFALAGPLAIAQPNAVERIVAVVGKEIVLKSDVDGQIELLAQRDPKIDRNDPKLRQYILDALINERLVVSKALEDSVTASDDEVTQRMDYQIQMLVQQFGSEKRIEDIYGMSMARIRREFREEIRKQILAEKIRNERFGNVKASRAEVEDFYGRYLDSLQNVPARVELAHIVKYIKASDDQKKETYGLALRIRDSIVKGGSFSDFARRYSADPGTASNGGDLGFVEKGKFVPAFEAAAFAMQPNEISQPVETPFGYHIIQLIDKNSSAINARHILLRVGQSDSDRDRARQALLDVKKKIEEGMSFEDAARQFSEEKETMGFGGSMGQVDLARLPEDMRSVIINLKDGGMSDPMPYAADPTKPGFHIMYRKQLVPEHKPTLQEDIKLIEQMAAMEKKQRQEQEWIKELRRTLYWEIKQ